MKKISSFKFRTFLIIALSLIGPLYIYGHNCNDEINKESISPAKADKTVGSSKKISILGDSYSTFSEYIPEGFLTWYMPDPTDGRTDVTQVDQTWWNIFINENGYQLEKNNSYSGSTICNTGYDQKDYSDRSFITRVNQLGNPDLIFVYGGTNDSWANSLIGEFVYNDWTSEQLKYFRPATAFLASELKKLYPQAEIVFLINGEDIIKNEIISSLQEICNHYGITYVMINDIEKMSGHPDKIGMRQIVNQIEVALNVK